MRILKLDTTQVRVWPAVGLMWLDSLSALAARFEHVAARVEQQGVIGSRVNFGRRPIFRETPPLHAASRNTSEGSVIDSTTPRPCHHG